MIRAHLNEMAIEEVANATTHGFGLVLSVVGFVVLLILAISYGDGWFVAGSVVYGASLVVLYAASTVYHTVIHVRIKRYLQLLDHCCIYLLIAGTYTPFLLTVLRGTFGESVLAFIWALAAIGIALKLVFRDRMNILGIVLYLAMGWIGVFAIKPMYDAIGLVPLILVVGGGVSYTLGMIFFGWHRIRHHHAIFHVFVLAGSILHYAAIVGYLIPKG
jgi:hemolysin III